MKPTLLAALLWGWNADGLALSVGGAPDHTTLYAVDPETAARRVVGLRDDLRGLGPDGAWLSGAGSTEAFTFALHAADGRTLATRVLPAAGFEIADVAWSADGRHVAVDAGRRTEVLDTATGAVTGRVPVHRLRPQALSPDGRALLDVDLDAGAIARVDLATGTRQAVTGPVSGRAALSAAWSSTGRVAVLYDGRVGFPGSADPPVALPEDEVDGPTWAPGGATLAVVTRRHCEDVVRLIAPGARSSVAVAHGSLRGLAWSPDGARIALQLDPVFDQGDPRRGARHPWPRRVRKTYTMKTPRGDRAVHAALVRFAVALRHGAGQERALDPLRARLAAIAAHPWGEDVTSDRVLTAIGDEASRWLRSAGYGRIEGVADLFPTC